MRRKLLNTKKDIALQSEREGERKKMRSKGESERQSERKEKKRRGWWGG